MWSKEVCFGTIRVSFDRIHIAIYTTFKFAMYHIITPLLHVLSQFLFLSLSFSHQASEFLFRTNIEDIRGQLLMSRLRSVTPICDDHTRSRWSDCTDLTRQVYIQMFIQMCGLELSWCRIPITTIRRSNMINATDFQKVSSYTVMRVPGFEFRSVQDLFMK